MLRLLSTADTDILATASALASLPHGFPDVRCANPAQDPPLDALLDGARVVVCRLLGGRRAWPEGFDALRARCDEQGIALVALGGEAEPDAELTRLSLAPPGAVAQAGEYLRHGGVRNTTELLRFCADTFLMTGHGFEPPEPLGDLGVYREADAPGRPTVGIVFYRSHFATGNTDFVDALCDALEVAGANPLAVWCYSLRGSSAAFEALSGRIDVLVTTVLASGGSNAADAVDGWDASALLALGVPVIQAVCATTSRAAWAASTTGLTPLDATMQVAIPEFDGRVLGGVVSFKERDEGPSAVGAPILRYRPDHERCASLARLAVRTARLRTLARPRVAILLTSFPTRHARVGNGVGLDTPASTIALLDALGVEHGFADGDALMHALIATGGHDREFLTDEQLAAAPLRLPVGRYAAWYAELPADLRAAIEAQWGPPPGDQYVDGDDFVVAGLELGDAIVAIQPPRGYGEDPVAVYHDPELAPTHHYLACYWWLDRVWGADAIVQLGKHGTLEWLPGKGLGLSASCAPDAVLGDIPLVYPFIVNDPGEGVQAKRRAHAVIVDHLVPPMQRAETYDELAELEQLLDEYARLEVLDPGKLPALATRIWGLVEAANLQRDIGVKERPDDLGLLVGHLDGYLCEIKDVQIKDGLHVLGRPPAGEQLRGLVGAIGRLGSGDVPGLRRAIGSAFGVDEQALLDAPGARIQAPAALIARFPGPAASAADLVDLLQAAQEALLADVAARGWRADGACRRVLGVEHAGLQAALRFACEEVVPRLAATTQEIDHVLLALRGGFVPAGPSGSPTRGRADVLPTGRNFYSVDPKSLPTELSWDVGRRLAEGVAERHLREQGAYPETVGIVVWGTAAMRTHGDDVAEVLALLGVRPVHDRETRRVTGLAVIPLQELGRPRIDVTVRISGFFRDAFPNLVTLMDDAVAAVAVLDESDAENFVARHARADAERLAAELGAEGAWRRATTRVFGSKPGAYGAGLLQLVDARTWRDGADLAEVYEVWGGYAYGRGLDGVPSREAMRDCFARIAVAVKNVDTREHDLFDSDDYFQYHGGMVATVRALTGHDPQAYVGDSSDPARLATRTLAEESSRVFRSRVANPRWIGSMIRHGYKGAFELAATVDYLFGYDATTGVVEDWMYEQVAARYLLDPDIAAFLRRSNPWAARAMTERLLEAAERGMWAQPDESTLAELRDSYLELEGEMEEAR